MVSNAILASDADRAPTFRNENEDSFLRLRSIDIRSYHGAPITRQPIGASVLAPKSTFPPMITAALRIIYEMQLHSKVG